MEFSHEGAYEKLSIEDVVELGDECLGLKVVVNRKGNSLMGVISYVLHSRRILTIEKVCDPKTERNMLGMRNLFFSEIVNVIILGMDKKARARLLKDVYEEDQRGKQLLMKKLVHPHLSGKKEVCFVDEDVLLGRVGCRPNKTDGMGNNRPKEAEALPPPPLPKVHRPEKWVIIDSVDDAFKKAITVIQSENDVSVAMEGRKIGRTGTLAWMSVATSNIIFLFDMVKIGASIAFKAGLKDILMDSNLLKIIHDCRAMEDMLHHQFSINLNNVYDTQAAEVYLYMVNHKSSVPMFVSGLPSLLIQYLKLSRHHVFFSHVRDECIQNDESIWFERPLPLSLSNGLAQCVMYLRELRLIQLKFVMVDLMQITNLYLGSRRDKDSATIVNLEPHVVPAEVQRLGRHCANNTVHVHDPHITYSKDVYKILAHGK